MSSDTPLEPAATALENEGAPLSPPGDVRPPPQLARCAPTFQAYHLVAFERDEQQRLLSLARLPPWPMQAEEGPREEERDPPSPAFGHGWGPYLDGLVGHGLAPGELIGLGASSAGAGKTAFLMQLVDGLALRNLEVARGKEGWGPALTPVLVASEMSLRALSWRSLARWTGHPAYYFRAGKSLLEAPGERGQKALAAARAARMALREGGDFYESRAWLRLLDGLESGQLAGEGAAALVEHLRVLVEQWRDELARAYPNREIVPVVVIDPLQRYQASDDDIRDLNALARELCTATLKGNWISLMTSDTNKAAAKGDRGDGSRSAIEEGSAAFRGSYGLIHELSAALYLRRPPEIEPSEDEKREGLRYIEAVLVKNRWGSSTPPWPRDRWYGATGRFWPMTRESIEAHDRRIDAARLAGKERASLARKSSPNDTLEVRRSGLL